MVKFKNPGLLVCRMLAMYISFRKVVSIPWIKRTRLCDKNKRHLKNTSMEGVCNIMTRLYEKHQLFDDNNLSNVLKQKPCQLVNIKRHLYDD